MIHQWHTTRYRLIYKVSQSDGELTLNFRWYSYFPPVHFCNAKRIEPTVTLKRYSAVAIKKLLSKLLQKTNMFILSVKRGETYKRTLLHSTANKNHKNII